MTAPHTNPSPTPRRFVTVLMSINQGAWQTIAQGATGAQTVAIPQGSTQFAVVWGIDPSEQLATTTVTGTSPDPPLCGLTPTGPAVNVAARFSTARRHPQSTTVVYNTTAKISGTVTTASEAPAANQTVCVVGQALGGPRQGYGSTTTDTQGRFSYRVPPGTSRTLSVAADTATGPVIHRLHLAVRTAVPMHATPSRLRNHQRVVLRGRVAEPIPAGGVTVLMQVWRTGRWQTFQSVTTRRDGRFRDSWLFLNTFQPTTYRMRALVPAQAPYPYARTGSHAISVHVR